jgi:hypothetical protein
MFQSEKKIIHLRILKRDKPSRNLYLQIKLTSTNITSIFNVIVLVNRLRDCCLSNVIDITLLFRHK